MIPAHTVIDTLKAVPGERVVLRTGFGGRDAVTRILALPVELAFDPLIASACTTGRGSLVGLPEQITLTLDAYRLRSGLGRVAGLPRVLGAGVAATVSMGALGRAPYGKGHVWITTEWVEGQSLKERFDGLPFDQRGRVLADVLAILESLHEANVMFGDVKPTNVIVTGETVSFIDIDTMREVASPRSPVPIRDYTPRYAAPETSGQRIGYLASDVYSFGVMVATLATGRGPEDTGFPGPLPAPWDRLVEACLQGSPANRPSAAQLLAHLRSGTPLPAHTADERTERVEDPNLASPPPLAPASEVVVEPETTSLRFAVPTPTRATPPPLAQETPELEPVPAAEPQPVATTRSPGRYVRASLVIALLVVAGLGGVVLLGLHARAEREEAIRVARHLVSEARAKLKEHKTKAAMNGQAVIEQIVASLEPALGPDTAGDAQGVHALALVWAQRWHWSKAVWDEPKFAAASVAVAAAARGASVEGTLADALLASAACRKLPEQDPRRAPSCAHSKSTFREVVARLQSDTESGWLLVEAVWGEVVVTAHESWRLRRNGLLGEAEAKASEALEHCVIAVPHLGSAPVNGRELMEDCLSVAGAARDFTTWFALSHWLIESDLSFQQRLDPKRTLPKLYTFAAPECQDQGAVAPTVQRDGRPRRKGPADGGWTDFCLVAGLFALGCVDEAEAARPQWRGFLSSGYVTQEGVPWKDLVSAANSAPTRSCALPK